MKLIFSILSSVLLFAQSYSQNSEFSYEGVSIKWENDWEMSEQDPMDGDGYYLALEKTGEDESGLVAITWINVDLEESAFLAIFQEQFYSSFNNQAEINFSEFYETKFAEINALATDFEFDLFGLHHRGTIYTFRLNGKSFGILKQEATEDAAKNAAGFKKIENNFKVI
ncbi:hypothetical protein [Moheibacter sp.]|uniref:hypothetical protein n=1 Tax=Moheibacter sp. TaxID=1965316 RepID=UPI003C721AEB